MRARLDTRGLDPDRERDVVDDLAEQLEEAYRDAISRGLSETEAETAALDHVPDWTALAREVAQSRRLTPGALDRLEQRAGDAAAAGNARAGFVGGVVHDVRYAMRLSRQAPWFTAVAVLTLALGIGANSAIFSVVNAVVLKPLPYKNPDRLVVVWERNTTIGKDKDPVAPLNYSDWSKQNTEFEDMAAFRHGAFTLTGLEYPEQVQALSVTSSLFRTLGVEAAIGRTFTEEEAQKRDRVVVLRSQLLAEPVRRRPVLNWQIDHTR